MARVGYLYISDASCAIIYSLLILQCYSVTSSAIKIIIWPYDRSVKVLSPLHKSYLFNLLSRTCISAISQSKESRRIKDTNCTMMDYILRIVRKESQFYAKLWIKIDIFFKYYFLVLR